MRVFDAIFHTFAFKNTKLTNCRILFVVFLKNLPHFCLKVHYLQLRHYVEFCYNPPHLCLVSATIALVSPQFKLVFLDYKIFFAHCNNLKFFVATSTYTLETRCHLLETFEKNYLVYTLRSHLVLY